MVLFLPDGSVNSASLGHTGHLPNRSFSVCGLAGRARFALHGEKAHCSVACGSIHVSTFLWPGLQTGPILKLVIFMQIWPFNFFCPEYYNVEKTPHFILVCLVWILILLVMLDKNPARCVGSCHSPAESSNMKQVYRTQVEFAMEVCGL